MALALVLLMFSSCLDIHIHDKRFDPYLGEEFFGYYHSCEAIDIKFSTDSLAIGRITSTEFVGHFSDVIYGHYTYCYPYGNIVWDKYHPKNVAYRDSLPQPDSLRINETKDTIWMYEGDECFVLKKEIKDEK